MKSLLGLLVVGLLATAVVLGRAPERSNAAPPARAPEKPWLAREAEAQILGPRGTLGPLFEGVTLGGPAPSPALRARIAAFARANDVAIELEIVDDELVAVSFDVTFGGCCGYEGVDALGARIGRAKNVGGCGAPTFFWDNWALADPETGTHVRGRVDVNRLRLRWEPLISLDEVVHRAEQAFGADRAELGHLVTLEASYILELPYPFSNHTEWSPSRGRPEDRGLALQTLQRFVTSVSFTTADPDAPALLVKRWGKPRLTREGDRVWHRGDRTMTATHDAYNTTVTIARR